MAPMDGTTLILITLRFSGIKKMKQFNLSKIKAAGTTVGDVYFPQTELLLPLEGTNGATTTSDLSNRNRSIVFAGTGGSISSAASKFGNTSMLFDSTGHSRLQVSVDSTLNATGDFTIEAWIYDTSTDGYPTFCWNSASGFGVYMYLGNNATSGSNKVLRMWSNNSVTVFSTELPQSQWYHFALVRSGTSVKLYINGTADATVRTDSGTYLFGDTSTLEIGSHSTQYPFNGYMDDIRMTKGVARYTSNFTPPTSAHLTSAGDVNKQIIVNSAADGVAIGTGGINQARVAKAWADIDGSQAAANMIASSYNISSITDHATGVFSFNFSTAMADANYSAVTSLGLDGGLATSVASCKLQDKTTALTKVRCTYRSSGAANDYDYNIICLIVFGN